jgi:hypothetical protein
MSLKSCEDFLGLLSSEAPLGLQVKSDKENWAYKKTIVELDLHLRNKSLTFVVLIG